MPVPKKEKLPASHSPLPLDDEQPFRQYAPAGHALHAAFVPLPGTEKLPAEHKPLPLEELHPDRQNNPAGQDKHEKTDIKPLTML